MKVFKFGGASVQDADRIRHIASLIRSFDQHSLLIVISAMGKTTNALELVVEHFFAGNQAAALEAFASVKKNHLDIAQTLFGGVLPEELTGRFRDIFTEVEWLVHDKPVKDFNYYYDQIVCTGELLSTALISAFLTHSGIRNEWLDVRDIIRTDDNFRDARIDWDYSTSRINDNVRPLLKPGLPIITQGFIGSTDENESTTLGREGSDYTAAVFANILEAEDQTIWKDVKGVMNADPKQYEQAQWISELNYREVIEMAFYGAQVIHPKTIKPLQNKGIPLIVRSFNDVEATGTVIHNKHVADLPSIIVNKSQQAMLEIASRDFSFVSEGLTDKVYEILAELRVKPNLTQTTAISMLCVMDDVQNKVEQLAVAASASFEVRVTRGLRLLTVRHDKNGLAQSLMGDAKQVLRQETPDTIQVVLID